jgi:hypothetical protein
LEDCSESAAEGEAFMSEAEASRPTQEFTISFTGGELPAEAADRIHKALHRAVLQEIADLDLSERNAIRFINLDKPLFGGHTQGIRAELELEEL